MLTFTNVAVNIVLDGNSNVASSQTPNPAQRLTAQLSALAPLNGNVTIKNFAKGGATWKTMLSGVDGSGISEVNAAYESGKVNILIVMEDFNAAIIEGATATVLADRQAYINAVKAAHPDWRMFLMTVPAGKDDGGGGYNTIIDECNSYLRLNWASMGLEGFIELRPTGGPFDYHPPYVYTESTFVKSGYYIDDAHWSPSGIAVVAGYMANTLAAMPDVAPAGTPGSGGGAAATTGSGNILLGWL